MCHLCHFSKPQNKKKKGEEIFGVTLPPSGECACEWIRIRLHCGKQQEQHEITCTVRSS